MSDSNNNFIWAFTLYAVLDYWIKVVNWGIAVLAEYTCINRLFPQVAYCGLCYSHAAVCGYEMLTFPSCIWYTSNSVLEWPHPCILSVKKPYLILCK